MIRTVWVVLSPKIQDLMPIISIFLLLYFTVVLLSEMVPFLISVPISNWKFPCYGHFSNNGWIWLSKLIQLGMHIKWNFWEDCKWKWNIEKCSLWLWFQICDNFSFFSEKLHVEHCDHPIQPLDWGRMGWTFQSDMWIWIWLLENCYIPIFGCWVSFF